MNEYSLFILLLDSSGTFSTLFTLSTWSFFGLYIFIILRLLFVNLLTVAFLIILLLDKKFDDSKLSMSTDLLVRRDLLYINIGFSYVFLMFIICISFLCLLSLLFIIFLPKFEYLFTTS